jgi:hypothetical protein
MPTRSSVAPLADTMVIFLPSRSASSYTRVAYGEAQPKPKAFRVAERPEHLGGGFNLRP